MQSTNTLLYHTHIINNIDKLDKRKDGYIGHRIEFLQDYCTPVRRRIQAIKEDIKHYEKMRDTQYEVIEAQPDIMKLKKEIADYGNTNSYFQHKMEEFDRCIAQLEAKIVVQNKQIKSKKESYKHLYQQNGCTLVSLRSKDRSRVKTDRSESKSNEKIQKSKDKYREKDKGTTSIYGKESLKNSRGDITIGQNQSEKQSTILPEILDPRQKLNLYNYNRAKQVKIHRRNQARLMKILEKQENNKSLRYNDGSSPNPQTTENSKLQISNIQQFKQAMTQFDHTEALFRECFQRKKLNIQKSVSQLQSKLITHKQLFLSACQAIGQRRNKVSVDDFLQLTTDEIITLFISFSWLTRKVYGQFADKRKQLMGVSKVLKQTKTKQE